MKPTKKDYAVLSVMVLSAMMIILNLYILYTL